MSALFDELLESVQQMDEIVKGERAPSREFHVDAIQVKNPQGYRPDSSQICPAHRY